MIIIEYIVLNRKLYENKPDKNRQNVYEYLFQIIHIKQRKLIPLPFCFFQIHAYKKGYLDHTNCTQSLPMLLCKIYDFISTHLLISVNNPIFLTLTMLHH